MPHMSQQADEPNSPEEPTTAAAAPGEITMRTSHEEKWERSYNMLLEYRSEHGDCHVPYNYPPNVSLANWVRSQRKAERKGTILPERKARLDGIGFVWRTTASEASEASGASGAPRPPRRTNPHKKHADAWEKKFEMLLEYRAAHGDCRVTHAYSRNKPLAEWVRNQRKLQKRGKMKPERKARLDEVGFYWSASDRRVPSPAAALSPTDAASTAPAAVAPALPPPHAAARKRRKGSGIESLLVEASVALGRSRDDALPHVSSLEHQWLFEREHLRGMDVDTLARFIPYGLARKALKILDGEQSSATEGERSSATVGLC